VYQWKKGDLFVFDRTHLHSASSNINKKKIGLATFTKK
jgi:ectoine hydroxylase-related dioxygenase (phytanoyl-CoA dioxygenase family)